MRATVVSIDAKHATVRLTPSWLGRLFGGRVVEVELVNVSTIANEPNWRTKGTGRHVERLIENALDYREVADPAPMRLIKEQG